MSNFTMTVDEDGVAAVRFDTVGRSMNTLTNVAWQELDELIARVAGDPAIRGAVIFSGKDNGFCAGANLDELMADAGTGPAMAEIVQRAVVERLMTANLVLRRLETCGKPFAAAIAGLALGGGLELALACHYRVVADEPGIRLGLPEATIGLLPGGGGTQRLVRLLGIARAMPLLLDGNPLPPSHAFAAGMIEAIVPRGQELAAARSWVLEHGDPVARWDRPGFVLPGEDGGELSAATGVSEQRILNYPAVANIIRAVDQGARLPMDQAIVVETERFVDTLQSRQAKAMIRTLFRSHAALRKGASRPAGITARTARKVSVLGAGMMGAGIAYVLAEAGIETILLDVTVEAAQEGKAYSVTLLDRLVKKGVVALERADERLARIHPTADYARLAGSDLVVESVFEDIDVKGEATRSALGHLDDTVIFASNTSTLPIGRLAKAHPDPARFIGMHFHSPVDRMELVEIVIGKETSRAAVAHALDLVRQIGKTAILVQDSPFFYTSRVFDTYIREGMEMLVDGIAPTLIDEVGRKTGMPRGPLELTDDVAIDLVDKIARQRVLILGDGADRRRSDEVVSFLIKEGRFGRKNGMGFYNYDADGRKRIWAGLMEAWPVRHAKSSPELVVEMRRRFLHRQAIEAARCLDEGVLDDPRHADVGAVLGWGFPRWTGGPISYIEQIGLPAFVEQADALALKCGARFAPPGQLRRMAETEATYYDNSEV